MEVEHASTNSRDENAENNYSDDQSIQDSAVKHSTVTLYKFFPASRL